MNSYEISLEITPDDEFIGNFIGNDWEISYEWAFVSNSVRPSADTKLSAEYKAMYASFIVTWATDH